MTKRQVDLYECDGPCNPCMSVADEQGTDKPPIDWLTLAMSGRTVHLCASCTSSENVNRLYREWSHGEAK